jgi:hypothetical protein
MQQPIYVDRPKGESRQTTIERLRRCLIPANQVQQDKEATTIIDVPNPEGGHTKFTFVGAPSREYIVAAVNDAFELQANLRILGITFAKRRAPTFVADTTERHNGRFAKSTRSKFRENSPDLYNLSKNAA